MPPRVVVAAVVVGWLATVAWLASEKWSPRNRPGQPPGLALDLADEVAPQQASWLLYRRGERIGNAETKLAPRKDGLFELTTRLRELELEAGGVRVKASSIQTTRTVTRGGDLVSLESRATIKFVAGGPELPVTATLKGLADGDEFHRTCDFDAGPGPPLAPVRLVSRRTFSPLLPVNKYPPLRAGQSWREANIDPVSEILAGAVRQFAPRPAGDPAPGQEPIARPPAEVLARVRDDAEELVTPRGQRRACWIIDHSGDGLTATTWVDAADGKVWRHEASVLGETFALVRD
jgi:hypothetical protein